MAQPANASDENRRLRRTVRDLVDLSTLPTAWIGLGPDRIASSLADVLLNTLSLDLIYVRLAVQNGEGVVEFVRRKNQSDALAVDVARAAFAPLLTTDRTESSILISDPFDGGPLHVTVIRFGGNDDQGVLVCGSCNPDFPTELDRALLGVGANQAAIVLQRRRADEQVQKEREWLRVTLASIGDGVIATDTQGRVTYLNAVAEELTGWTPNSAEGEPLERVFPILNEDTRRPIENPVEQVLRKGVVVGLANHTILIAKDGTERPIDDSAAPIRDAAGKMLGVVLIFREVTEQRRATRELRESEARKSAILETALDSIISMDHEGKVFDFNSAAERTFGYSRGDVIGRELAGLIIPPSLRERHQQGMAHFLATGEGPVLGKRLELPALRADGSEFPVELAITRILTDGPPLFTAYLRDISERTRAEQYRNARLGVTQVLNQASDVREGASKVLQTVCESLDWDVGFFWIVNKGGDGIECHESWHKPDVPVIEFEAASFSREFKKGEGLPGQSWSTGKPCWLLDVTQDANFLRAASAARYDLHSAFASPVAVGDRILGVIEFFTKRIHEPDHALLEMMGTVAASLGQFIERTAAEAAVRRSEQELADFFENATVGLHWLGPDGAIVRANRAELAMLGYSSEEYVGRHIADFHADEDVISDILRRLQTGENLNDYPARLRCKDGSIKEVLIDSSALFQEGSLVRTRCFTRDVTERKRAEAALRESEEKLRLLADTIPQLVWMAKPDGYIFWYNRRWYEYTGTTPEEMEGWGWQSVHDPETLPKVLDRWKGSIASGQPFEMVFPLRGEDKQFRPFLTRVNPLRDEQGRILYWFGTNTDIGDIKAMEEALQESEQRFRQLADAMPQIVWTARPDGTIDYLNRRWCEFTGLPQTVTNDAWGPLLHPDDAPAAHERWAACVQSGAPFEMEFRLLDRRKQGYRWHLIRTVAVPDGYGGVARWFGTSTDIHEQKRAEESSRFLAEASAELASVVDYESTLQKVANLAVPYFADWCAVDLANEDGNLRRLAVAHSDPEKFALVRELMREYPPDPQSPVGVYAVLRTGKPELVGEITDDMLVREAKSERHLRLLRSLNLKSYICVPLVISGNTLGLLTFATAQSGRNYTEADLALAMDLAHRAAVAIENTQLYQALRETDRRKDEFLATLAHELRNPLAPVCNALQILKMPRVDSQTVERLRDMMDRQVQHLVRLVDDLLDVSRVMRGKIQLRKEMVELSTVVARAVETVQPLVDAQGHLLSVHMSSDSLLLDADPVRLAQVVGNLLTNAAKYAEPNGRIWLKGEREGGMAVLRVRDTGIGIREEILPRIFELFVQVEHASPKAQGGLGIGLTLVKNLVEMHNGTVKARSDGLGRGSEFVVRLPLVEQIADQDHGSDTARQAYQYPPPSGKRVLVVDDNQDAADSLAMLLKLQRHEVRVAYSGMAALEMIKTYTPDVVLLDIGMPGMDGYEVARRLRQTSGLGNVVLAALTGWGQQEDRRRTAEAGFDHHLVKPPEPEALEQLLAK